MLGPGKMFPLSISKSYTEDTKLSCFGEGLSDKIPHHFQTTHEIQSNRFIGIGRSTFQQQKFKFPREFLRDVSTKNFQNPESSLEFFCNMVWPWRFVPTFLSFDFTKDQFENPSTSLDEFDQGSEAASCPTKRVKFG